MAMAYQQELANLMNNDLYRYPEIGSEHWVDVTHINNPHSFFVRPTACRMFMDFLHSYGDQLQPNEAYSGKEVVFKSKTLQTYVRGQLAFVDHINDEIFCDIFAMDYGCFERSVPLENIHENASQAYVPKLAYHCQLVDCHPRGGTWHNDVVKMMKHFIGGGQVKIIIRGKMPDVTVVSLLNSCPEDLATMLAYSGHCTIGHDQNMINRFAAIAPLKMYYTYRQYVVGDTVHVRVLSGDSVNAFYVAEIDDYRNYVNEKDNLTQYCSNQRSLEVENLYRDMGVAALDINSNKYERGIVREIFLQTNKARVQLVDSGKEAEVPTSRLKKMSEAFYAYPATAIYCKGSEDDLWDNGLKKFLYPGYEFNITIKEVGYELEKPHVVELSPYKC